MGRSFIAAASLLVLLFAGPTVLRAEESDTAKKLVGTWKLLSAKYGGTESKLPQEATTLKHITPSQFQWVTYDGDGKIIRSAGGGYVLQGEDYTETPEYGLSGDFDVIKGKSHSFKCRIEGNQWHHEGKLDNGLTIEEVWERVEKK